MGNEWREVKLGDVINFNPRESIKKGTIAKKIGMDKLDTFCRKINGYEETEFKSGTKFRNGDTLLARITPCLENGKTAQVDILEKDEVAFGSTEFIVMREKEGITINNFIYYLSISNNFRNLAIKSMTGTSGRQRAQKDVIENTIINLPSLPIQKKIAEILSSLDDKIELNNQMNKTLEDMAQAIFKQWFVDFEFPNENGEPYKSSGGEMVESELGLIPKGWSVKELKEVFSFVKGKKPKDIFEKKYENMKNYLTIDVLNSNGKLFANPEKVILVNKFNNLMVMDGASSGTIFYGKDGIVASTLSKLEVINNEISDDFLYFIIKYYENDIKQHTTGSAIPHTDKEYVYRIKIAFTNSIILESISNKLKNIRNKIIENKEEIENLTQIRDTLLPKLMNGEIDVNEVKI